jgi:peptidyl-prolyl cis-trans isomerase C
MKIAANVKTTQMALWFALCLVACSDQNPAAVATVNGKAISQSEFDAYLKYRNVSSGDASKRKAALDEYVRREGLASAIESAGLLDSEALRVEINEHRKELLISRYFEQYLRDKVTDQAVLNYYNGNPAQFEEERVHVAHILLRTQRDMDDSERNVKLTTAQEVYSKLMAGGDFTVLAADYSEDKVSGKKGGDLGWLKRGAISQVFSEKVFGLEEGVITEPFETPFGFHVVKLIEPPQTIRKAFETVKGDIRYQLRNQAKQAELARLIGNVEIEGVEIAGAGEQ